LKTAKSRSREALSGISVSFKSANFYNQVLNKEK